MHAGIRRLANRRSKVFINVTQVPFALDPEHHLIPDSVCYLEGNPKIENADGSFVRCATALVVLAGWCFHRSGA
jgi:hypothetical protein